jgi:hypothetical protein
MTTLALGRLPTRHDPRTLRLASYLTPALPPPPARVDWARPVPQWPMYGNDEYSDCTCAAKGHLIAAWRANAGAPADVVDTAAVLAAYTAISGFDPGPPTRNDNGAYMLDSLNHWRRRGVGGHKIAAFVAVDTGDLTQIHTAIALFGGVYVGFDLPASARTQFHARAQWRKSIGGPARKGSWGGHAMTLLGYDDRRLWGPTWSRLQPMTAGFATAYLDEAYAAVSVDQLDAAGHSPTGLDLDKLQADLAAL